MWNVLQWIGHELLHFTGSDDPTSTWYGFFSGFGGDTPILGAVALYLWHRNCHVKGCWRAGLHKVDGTPYVVCKTHHPHINETERVTAETVANAARPPWHHNKED